MKIKNEKEYQKALTKLRKHFQKCDCFLPNLTCTEEIEDLKTMAWGYLVIREKVTRGAVR